MRREEKQECTRLLEGARFQWLEEREQLLKGCEDMRQKSLHLEKSTLESTLKDEFDDRLAQIHLSHERYVKDTVGRTWSQAEIVKDKILEKARVEERQVAREIASELAQVVQKEKEDLLREAELSKQKALKEQKEMLKIEHKTYQLILEQELQSAYDRKTIELCEQYESELLASQQLLEEKTRRLASTQQRLKSMTGEKESWVMQYNSLKREFSDFIAQFPGFNADFLLK